MDFRTLIVSMLAAVLASYGAASESTAEVPAEISAMPNQIAELKRQREKLAARLDLFKPFVAARAESLNRGDVMQWHNWSNWQNGWSNY